MRVAVLSSYFAPFVGGIASQVEAVATEQARLGLDMHVITRQWDDAPREEQVAGVAVHRLPLGGNRVKASSSFVWQTVALVRKLQPDIVHAHELLLPTTTAIAARPLVRSSVVVTVHSSGPALGECARLLRARLGRERLPLIRSQVDAFVAISAAVERDMEGIGIPSAKRHVIPNGVDVTRFRPVTPQERSELRRSLGLPEGRLVVYTGRLVSEKRVVELARLWPAVRSTCGDAELVLVGSGPDAATIRSLAVPGVTVIGPQPNIAPYLQAADLSVLASASEGFSMSVLEALACGLPTVATRVGAVPEMMSAAAGHMVAADDFDALQQALIDLLAVPEEWQEMGAAARAGVVERYALPTVAQQVTRLYQSLL